MMESFYVLISCLKEELVELVVEDVVKSDVDVDRSIAIILYDKSTTIFIQKMG